MEFTDEQIKEIGLSEEQVPKVVELVNANESTLKKEWDGKANLDAEKILHSVSTGLVSLTGIQHEKGVKYEDYIKLAGESYLKGQKANLERQSLGLAEKIKNTKGDDLLKEEHEKLKEKFDLLQQSEAKFKDWEENDYKGKFELLTKEVGETKVSNAFMSIKPSFPDTVNSYEAEGRWNEFVKETKKKYDIDFDDKTPIGIDKENKHSIIKLKDLLDKNKEIAELKAGRKLTGLGGEKTDIEVEGVPFKINENATSQDRAKAIKDYLTGELKLSITSDEYSFRYSEYNKKLLEKIPAKK